MPLTFEQERHVVVDDLRALAREGGGVGLDGEELDALADLLARPTEHAALKLARLLVES